MGDLENAKVIEAHTYMIVLEKSGKRYRVVPTGIKLDKGGVFYEMGDPHLEVSQI